MRRKHKKMWLFSYVLLVVILVFLFFSFLEYCILPPLKEISHMQCKTVANHIIDNAALDNLRTMDCSALLSRNEDNYTANTSLINSFCASLSSDITEELEHLPPEYIQIPIGVISNLSFFANKGPMISFTLIPMGAAKVDYETSFSSAGINQINYKIWLTISMELKIVNPLYQETVIMERKLMLADLIFGGKVPDHYFQLSQPDEYLLTE